MPLRSMFRVGVNEQNCAWSPGPVSRLLPLIMYANMAFSCSTIIIPVHSFNASSLEPPLNDLRTWKDDNGSLLALKYCPFIPMGNLLLGTKTNTSGLSERQPCLTDETLPTNHCFILKWTCHQFTWDFSERLTKSSTNVETVRHKIAYCNSFSFYSFGSGNGNRVNYWMRVGARRARMGSSAIKTY